MSLKDDAFDLDALVLADLPFGAYYPDDDDERRPSDDPARPGGGRTLTRYPAREIRHPVQVRIPVRITARWPRPLVFMRAGTVSPVRVGRIDGLPDRSTLIQAVSAARTGLEVVRVPFSRPSVSVQVGVQVWSAARIREDDEEVMELF